MEKLKMQSRDVVGGNVEKIAALFPQCVTERLNKDGKPELAIDFDKLRAELSNVVLEDDEERYQFTWPDKRAASRLANERVNLTLRPCREESVDFDTTENLYIEGDNLDVLKVLRETYLGRVKMIYIDPPYNTGNDFVYSDDFAQRKEDFEQGSGLFDAEGNQTIDPMQRNTEANGRFHTDWLNMIYPRLKVARNLLTDDGVIFISIDDHEVENLRKVCDEIFGERNCVCQFVWKNKYGAGGGTNSVAYVHEYILAYSKSPLESITSVLSEDLIASYSKQDEKFYTRGGYVTQPLASTSKGARANLMYAIHHNGETIYPPKGGRWIWSKEKFDEAYANNEIVISKTATGYSVRFKQYLKDENGVMRKGTPLSLITSVFNQEGTKEFSKILGDKRIFDFPKPTELIKYLLSLTINDTTNDFTVLDFFSGSASTAHAVMQLNAEDGGKRRFIMVQLPEVTDEKSEARKAGFESICEIGKERIRRAGRRIIEEMEKDKGNVAIKNGKCMFDIELQDGQQITPPEKKLPDTGFRVLKLDSSNMEDVFYTPDKFEPSLLDNLVDNIKADRSGEDLLFQVMLNLGIELSAKIERKEVAGKEVFSVDDDYLLACFDTDVNETTIEEMAKLLPTHLVIRDASAANDNVLDNFDQIIESYSNEKKITTHIL